MVSRILKGLLSVIATASIAFAATVTYQPDTSLFPNPERGYFSASMPPWPSSGTVDAWEETSQSWTPPLSASMMAQNRASGVTLHAMRYNLSMFRNSPLSQAFLDRIDADAAQARASGVKLNVRFLYSWFGCRPDATKSRIIEHIAQLRQYFVKNVDVIAYVEAGFVGCWGEWHSSQNGLLSGRWGLDVNDLSREILDSLFAAVPSTRMICFRYPTQKMQYFHPNYTGNYESHPTPVPSASDAYTGTAAGRAGYYCDSFRADALDGTWHSGDSARVKQETLYSLMEGEMDLGLGNTATLILDRVATRAKFREFHWSAINLSQDLESSTYAPNWKSDGFFYEVAKHLGYRFRMVSAEIPASVGPGDTLNLSIQMANDGWARIYNPRSVELILRNQSGHTKHVFNIDKGVDNRLWLPGPGEIKNMSIAVFIPPTMPAGDYDVLLNLPDPEPSIHDRPEYSIRLANSGVWEPSTGYNKLLHTLTIQSTTRAKLVGVNLRNVSSDNSNDIYYSLRGRDCPQKATGLHVNCYTIDGSRTESVFGKRTAQSGVYIMVPRKHK